jgi:predicted GIY-YIG superfamily endonuclease
MFYLVKDNKAMFDGKHFSINPAKVKYFKTLAEAAKRKEFFDRIYLNSKIRILEKPKKLDIIASKPLSKVKHDQYYVYAIHCKINSRIYVGRTNNKDQRSYTHFSKLRRKSHINKELQADFNVWKEHNFSFEIIEFCETLQESIEIESLWIKKTSSRCYNVSGKIKKIS